jgi:hypothetical protein
MAKHAVGAGICGFGQTSQTIGPDICVMSERGHGSTQIEWTRDFTLVHVIGLIRQVIVDRGDTADDKIIVIGIIRLRSLALLVTSITHQ